MSLEKKHQDEFTGILNQYGFALKNEDMVICPRCHMKVHPKHTGIPDIFFMAHDGLSSFIECKGGIDRFNFTQIEEHQWRFADDLLRKTGREVWLMLVTGNESVVSKSPLRRRMWLLPYHEVKNTIEAIEYLAGYKYIGVHPDVGHMSKFYGYNMEQMWTKRELIRIKGNWEIPLDHPFATEHFITGVVNGRPDSSTVED